MAERAKKSEYSERARKSISKEIKHHVDDEHMPQEQAVAAAMNEAREKGMKVPRQHDKR